MIRARSRAGALLATAVLVAACSNGNGGADRERGDGRERRAPEAVEETGSLGFAPTPLPEARTEVAGALWNGHLAVTGGFAADATPSDRLELLDADGRWTRGPDLPSARDHTSLAVLGDRLYLVGGIKTEDATSAPTDEVWSLGPGEREWRREPSLQRSRGALATVATDRLLVAVGGVDGTRALDTVEIFDPATGEWTDGPRMNVPREHTSAATVGNKVYAIAGRQLSLESNLTSVESLALPDGDWQTEPDLEHSRGGIGAAAVDGMPCVAGGEEPAGTIESIECLVDGRWTTVATLDTPRHGLAVVFAGGVLHVLGGGPEPGLTVSDAHEVIDPTP